MFCCSVFFLFKQKTAYEMRISDWSSDVCSSDLHHHGCYHHQRHVEHVEIVVEAVEAVDHDEHHEVHDDGADQGLQGKTQIAVHLAACVLRMVHLTLLSVPPGYQSASRPR